MWGSRGRGQFAAGAGVHGGILGRLWGQFGGPTRGAEGVGSRLSMFSHLRCPLLDPVGGIPT